MGRTYFSTFELLLLAVFAALVVVGNVALRLPVKLPGHSGVVWMALLVIVRGMVPKLGAASCVGVFSGLLAAFVGVGDKGGLDTLLSYTAAGAGVDLISGLLPSGALTCAVAGLVGNLAKLGVKVLLELWIGIPTGFLVVGRTYPALTHTVFGLAGGYLGALVLAALRRAGFFAYLAARR
ncbi:MAG TPA: cobalt ABC transporter permease [Candidatus Margulisiibacteriota bacterium]|nr:cobalt ABC transporter permease [Candidatus Margulisiibacteriota bacterium]